MKPYANGFKIDGKLESKFENAPLLLLLLLLLNRLKKNRFFASSSVSVEGNVIMDN